MSAESAEIEDPNDPAVILRDLPEQERVEFLRQYHAAVNAAHDPAGYCQLQRLLHVWRLTAVATSQAGYYEEIAAVRSGTVLASPAEEVVPGWQERRPQEELLTWSEARQATGDQVEHVPESWECDMSARMVVRPLSDICRADVKCQLGSARGPSVGPLRHVHRSANVTLLLRQLRSTGLM